MNYSWRGDDFSHGCLILHIHKTYTQKLISCLHALVFFLNVFNKILITCWLHLGLVFDSFCYGWELPCYVAVEVKCKWTFSTWVYIGGKLHRQGVFPTCSSFLSLLLSNATARSGSVTFAEIWVWLLRWGPVLFIEIVQSQEFWAVTNLMEVE